MMTPKIERIDTTPLIIATLEKKNVQNLVDNFFIAHSNWANLSYGQLTVLLITYVMHSLIHHFSGVGSWANQDKTVIEQETGWKVVEKDTTDDHLERLAQVLGKNVESISKFQLQMGQGIISAYQLPTKIVRYDTTAFNVYHDPENFRKDILEFSHSKVYRPGLLQFKQGLSTLDPAGVPMLSENQKIP